MPHNTAHMQTQDLTATAGKMHALLLLVALAAMLICWPAPSHAGDWPGFLRGPSSLQAVETNVARRYDGISHMPPATLAERLARRDTVLLIDVREASEFAVSRLQGAIRVTPGISIARLREKLQGRIRGRAIVFYCSVGERSSRLALRAKQQLLAGHATSVHNLKGGIFAWHNQNRALVDASGATPYVHPFNDRWGKLLQRRALARMTPAG